MPLTDTELNNLATTQSGRITHLAIHTADPGTTGANPSTAARLAVTWSVDADGDFTATNVPMTFTGGAANGPATYVAGWSALTAGTFRGSWALVGDQVFNSAGEYQLTSLVVNGTST